MPTARSFSAHFLETIDVHYSNRPANSQLSYRSSRSTVPGVLSRMKSLIATVVKVQEEPGDRYHATVTIVLPGDIEHVELMLEDICADADASALSDTDPGTHSIGISGSGKPPFDVGFQIPARAFERGALPP